MTTLLPFAADEAFTVVELGSGEGILSHTIALAFPHARIVALDGSESMRRAASARLIGSGDRVIVAPFELESSDWHLHLDGADAVVSSLAATWDEDVGTMAVELGDPSLEELFRSTEWNIYRYPDPMDRPSPLAAQLDWIEQAGFTAADCFWMEAGHAIYGGYKPGAGRGHVGYELALEAAGAALG